MSNNEEISLDEYLRRMKDEERIMYNAVVTFRNHAWELIEQLMKQVAIEKSGG
jgi:hypothetical protein